MMKRKTRKSNIPWSKSSLVDFYINLRQSTEDLEPEVQFWEGVHWLQAQGLCPFPDDMIRGFLREYDGFIQGRLWFESEEAEEEAKASQEKRRIQKRWEREEAAALALKGLPSIETLQRGAELYLKTVKEYGWVHEKDRVYHPELKIEVDKMGLWLLVKGERPCIMEIPRKGLLRVDDIVNLMMSALFDRNFIQHISQWDHGYPYRLETFLERRRNENQVDNLPAS